MGFCFQGSFGKHISQICMCVCVHIYIYILLRMRNKYELFELTDHLRFHLRDLRNAKKKACQNFDGWRGTYGRAYGSLTVAYGIAWKTIIPNASFLSTYGVLTDCLRDLTVLQELHVATG